MLTQEQADRHCKGLTDTELERLADQVGYGESDQRLMAGRALMEKIRRTEAVQQAARLAAPAIAARESAKSAYAAAGLDPDADPAAFDRWYQQRQGDEATRKLADQRAAARHIAARRF